MTTEIAPGIYQLKVHIPNNPLGNTNVYLLKGEPKHTLIDAGWNIDQSMQSLIYGLGEIGVSLKDIGQIVVTHAHFDHYGLVGRIKTETNAKVFLHRAETAILPRYNITDEFLRKFEQWFRTNGVPETETPMSTQLRSRFSGTPAIPDILLEGGETISNGLFELKVYWTPGHSPGHICLYEPQHKILFSGDHILPVITPNISLTPDATGDPLGEFIKSLNELKKLEVKIAAPAHEYLFYDLPKRVDEIIHHHELRRNEILTALNKNVLNAYQLSNRITWMEQVGGVDFKNLSPFDKRAAVSETLAHLKVLEKDNQVESILKDGVVCYKNHD